MLLLIVEILMISTTDLTISIEQKFSQGQFLSNLVYSMVAFNIILCLVTQITQGYSNAVK